MNRLGNLKNESIGDAIRTLTWEALAKRPEFGDPAEIAEEIGQIYAMRSVLVHGRKADPERIERALSRLVHIVPQILQIRFCEVAGAIEQHGSGVDEVQTSSGPEGKH
jgi:hypothetical protein